MNMDSALTACQSFDVAERRLEAHKSAMEEKCENMEARARAMQIIG